MWQNEAEEPLLEIEKEGPVRCKRHRSLHFVIFCLIISNAASIFFAAGNGTTKEKEVSKFAGLSYNTQVKYEDWTDFQDPKTRNQTWHDMDLTPLKVLYNDAEAKELGLDVSLNRFPWDENQGIYVVKAFHDIHCLKFIQYAFEHSDWQSHAEHVYHCLDSLRQDLMCSADDTPMPVTTLPDKIGVDQIRTCRDFDALVQWTKEPNRFPCYYRPVDDPRKPRQQIEAYGYCKEGSPYFEAQEAYFAKRGHIS